MISAKYVQSVTKEQVLIKVYGFAGSPRTLQTASFLFHPWLRDQFSNEPVRSLPVSPVRTQMAIKERLRGRAGR